MEENNTIYAINGSPRHNGNTAELLHHALNGAAEAGVKTEMIHLADYNFSGCMSCFACKVKNGNSYGRCAIRDELTPILEKLHHGGGMILGSPVYFGGESGLMRNFIERLFFADFRYDAEHSSLLEQTVHTAFFYTMNVNEQLMNDLDYPGKFKMLQKFAGRIFNSPEVPVLYACDTLQFDDYSKYDAEMFDPAAKLRSREENFPADCAKAFEIGREMAKKIKYGEII